jgi:DNA invertase Pin-like site-specific DNA recombinase
MGYAHDGDVIAVHTLDRLSRTVRDALNLVRK